MPDTVTLDLEEIDATDGWILEVIIDQQGGTEVGLLPVQILLSHILSSSRSHDFLRSVEITQESSSGGGREICHELCNWRWVAYMWLIIEVSDK